MSEGNTIEHVTKFFGGLPGWILFLSCNTSNLLNYDSCDIEERPEHTVRKQPPDNNRYDCTLPAGTLDVCR